jgi:hypothetical protein
MDGFKQQRTVVYETILEGSTGVDSSTVEIWRKEQLLKNAEVYGPKNIYSTDETRLFFTLPRNKTLEF